VASRPCRPWAERLPAAQHVSDLGQLARLQPTGGLPRGSTSDTVDSLILDLLKWIGPSPRPYAEVLEAWRTSCPRLPVWEDANARGFIARHHEPGHGTLVSVSSRGAEHLQKHRQPSSGRRLPQLAVASVSGSAIESPASIRERAFRG